MPEDSAPAEVLVDPPAAAGWIGTDPPPRGEAVHRLIAANHAAARESALAEGEAMRRLLALEALHALDRARISGLQQRVAAFEASTSWRLTAPLRWAGGIARRTRARLRSSAKPAGEPARSSAETAPPKPLSYRESITTDEPAILAELASVGPPAPDQPGLALAGRGSQSAASLAPAFPAALTDAVQDARIAAAQARRDRARLIEAQAEIARLRDQAGGVGALRGVARRAGRLLPAPLRAGLRRSPAASAAVPLHAARGAALVIDDHWPRVDRDSGSVDIDNLLTALADLGFDSTFLALREAVQSSPARERLEARGVRCVAARDAADAERFLARHGGAVDLCVLCRAFSGGAMLQAVRDHCGKARLVFNTIDLNYVREQRRAVLTGDRRLAELAQWAQQREEEIIRACDATLVVSTAELELLAHTMPDAYAVQMPLARPIRPPVAPFAARSGIGFIGGFAHAPNVDAVRSFLADTWPLVLRHLPDCTFSIVGADFPSDLLEGVAAVSQVRALGHVADIAPWFESLRLTVAPLRYGAGAKGKIASSLAAGVPCVASPVAAEGMQLQDGSGVLVAADPEMFAAHVRDVHNDAALWTSLSERAQAYARRTLSLDAWRDRLDAALLRLGL